MKAGAVRHPDNIQSVTVNEEMEFEPENNLINPNDANTNNILSALGFEEGELEMFFDISEGVVDNNQLVQKYLEIAQAEPYNLNWDSEEIAANADYDTGVLKPNGTTYTKHDIANDTLNSFYEIMSGGNVRRNKKYKTKKTRKNKKSKKSRKSRHRRRR